MKKFTFLWGVVLCLSASLSAQHLTTLEELEILEHQRSLTTVQQSEVSDSGELLNRTQSLTLSITDPEGIYSAASNSQNRNVIENMNLRAGTTEEFSGDIGELLNRLSEAGHQIESPETIFTPSEMRALQSHFRSQNRDAMADIIPTAGATETFTPEVGDFFFDPGGPGGGPDGSPGNYPNCGCLTNTTLAGVTELEFIDYEVFGTFDWLKLYDGSDNTGVLLFDNSSGGNGANTLAQLIAANGGSAVFTGTSGDFFFEFNATAVVNRLGWEVEILATGGGGGGGGTGVPTAFGINNATPSYGSFEIADPAVFSGISAGSGTANFEGAGAIDPNDNDSAYVIDNVGAMWSVDVQTGVYTSLGNVGVPDMTGLAFNPVDGELYGLTTTAFYSIDIGAVSATQIGSLNLPGGTLAIALAIDGDGNAFTYEIVDDLLYSIDTTTGAATSIGSIGFDANFGQGMAWDAETDQIYMAAFNGTLFDSELRSVDTATGNTTSLGTIIPGTLSQFGWVSIINSGSGGGGGGDCETPELEINQDVADACMANLSQTDLAQSFIPLSDVSAGAGFRFETASNDEDLILSLWDNLPNAGGTELATGTTTTSGDLWVDVFWDPVTVTPGNTYFLVIEGTVTSCVSGSLNDPYPDGNVFANPGYQPFPAFDYTFRTYTCDASGPTNNWECADATELTCGDVVAGTTVGATNSGGNASPDVFFSYTGNGDAEIVTISLCDGGTTYDSILRVFESCDDLSVGAEIAVNDDFCGLQSELTFDSDGTSTYIIMVEGFGSGSGDYSLEITCELPPPPPACGGVFTDTGGPDGDYSNNEDVVWTIEPDNVDDFVTVIFSEFDVEATWDALYVFDGPDTSSPLISSGNPPTGTGFPAGGFYGTNIPGPFASTHPSGALTFQFLSDGSVTRPGWVADVVCAPVPPPNDLIENAISVTDETQPYTDPEVRLQFATNELLNPDGCAIAGTPGVWYSFTAEIDGTAEASITDPSGTSFVIFYEAPSEDVGDETDLSFSPEPDNQCGPSTASNITTVAGQSYYIFVLNNGGPSDVVIDISGSLLSTVDNTIDGFTFYPNPTMDVLNLSSNSSIDTVELYTMLGQRVISLEIGATASQVDVSNLATGTYIMKVTAEGQTASYQVIKK